MQIHLAALDLHVDSEAKRHILAMFSRAQTRQERLIEIAIQMSAINSFCFQKNI